MTLCTDARRVLPCFKILLLLLSLKYTMVTVEKQIVTILITSTYKRKIRRDHVRALRSRRVDVGVRDAGADSDRSIFENAADKRKRLVLAAKKILSVPIGDGPEQRFRPRTMGTRAHLRLRSRPRNGLSENRTAPHTIILYNARWRFQ